mmetsp:Transcript_9029/g.21713  ORF Transcript_9029/g.21713 Transcript_9029/m.21713 type:complete len:98 (+) Transcript_9029:402-695(+)
MWRNRRRPSRFDACVRSREVTRCGAGKDGTQIRVREKSENATTRNARLVTTRQQRGSPASTRPAVQQLSSTFVDVVCAPPSLRLSPDSCHLYCVLDV